MFVYLGREDGIFKVKDTEDGKVDFFTEDELRFAIMQVGKIEGLSIDSWGNIIDSKNIILACAPEVKTYNTRGGNLARAKDEKNDEFYTRYDDVSAEMSHYPVESFKDKVIYCPTDVAVNTGKTKQSQFVRYFQMKAHTLQFKRLIASCRIDHATGEKDINLDEVQNCYVLEQSIVPESQRYVLVQTDNGQVVKKVVDELVDDVSHALRYKLEDGSFAPVPTHIVNQAAKDANGAVEIVRRYVKCLESTKERGLFTRPSEEDKGVYWPFEGHMLKYVWCQKYPGKTYTAPLAVECYVFSEQLYYGDWCPFMTDIDGNPLVEEVDGGYVGLRAPAYYNYVESDYEDFEYHCPPDIEFESGDFRSSYCGSLLERADIVCTNPPFSVFTQFMEWLLPANKTVLIVGNMNAITYKEVWPYIQADKLWLGHHPLGTAMWFNIPDSDKKKLVATKRKGQSWKEIDGEVTAGVAACWFTNLDNEARHKPMLLTHMYENDSDLYPPYVNYDAINVDKVSHIPMDYSGFMGVPITFIQKYCPEQFEIAGCTYNYGEPVCHKPGASYAANVVVDGESESRYKRIFIRKRQV